MSVELFKQLTPSSAWEPLPSNQWNEQNAAHLLRRIGFSATPDRVQHALGKGLDGVLEEAFGRIAPLETPDEMAAVAEMRAEYRRQRIMSKDPDERRKVQRMLRKKQTYSYYSFSMDWLQFARNHETSAQEKFVLFLQDVLVVARTTVKDPEALYKHQETLRNHLQRPYPKLVKAISRDPAMIRYLDLQRSSSKAPNENFARELFELFTLGEGNYTEADIKQAAKAFTGYRYNNKVDFFFNQKFHDSGVKTVFGQSGNWKGDDVIDIVFEQPAAETFLPQQMLEYYLTLQPVPDVYLRELGKRWKQSGYRLDFLIRTVFSSQLFYAPRYQANRIKSPIEYYLGLCQILNIDVPPVPIKVLNNLRAMGQSLMNPPNVRGWVYGKHWINSTTLSARRLLVRQLFTPFRTKNLNADDQSRVEEAIEKGYGPFAVTEERIESIAQKQSREIAAHFCSYMIPGTIPDGYQDTLASYIGTTSGKKRTVIVKEALISLLQSPACQLC